VLEQGLSFTVVEAPDPRDDPETPPEFDSRKVFTVARRVWLGWVPGVDWLHNAIEGEFGEDRVWYDVQSSRKAVHIGAAGEVAAVILILWGAGALEFARKFGGRLGERSADGLIDWVKELATRRRKELGFEHADPPPDFANWELDHLAQGMKGDLAEITGVPTDRLELLSAERGQGLLARYRDHETGEEFEVEAQQNEAVFKRLPPAS
jgi:hypothetical protein